MRQSVHLHLKTKPYRPRTDGKVAFAHCPPLGEISTVQTGDDALGTVDQRIEGTDDVVTVDAEIEREMVASPRWHARVWQRVLGGDRRHDRLRPAATRDAERAGPCDTASRTSSSRSLPGASSRGSIPRALALAASAKRSAFPPPERGL
jgi:hypothetical protein